MAPNRLCCLTLKNFLRLFSLCYLSFTGQPSKLLYVMHNSEFPLSCMALFEGGPCLTADANFDVLMVKLKSHFQNAKGHKVECRGSRYRYCDFLIKVGTVTMSSSARGISVEVWPEFNISSKGRDAPCQSASLTMVLFHTGRILSLCGPRGLLEPHEGVHAVFSWQQCSRTSNRVCCQTRGCVCSSGLCWHHDSVPGALQQTS